MKLPEEKILTQYIRFLGGLDLETPVLSIDPGACLDAVNYQPGLFGGYERIDAFERYDGRAAPSDATYYLSYVSSANVVKGQSIRGDTSGASAVVASNNQVQIGSGSGPVALINELVLTKVTGAFIDGENFSTSGGALPLILTMTYPRVVAGNFSNILGYPSLPTLRGYSDGLNDAIATNAAADIYRADIGPVPGMGPVRGVWGYKGVQYAFRDKQANATTYLNLTGASGGYASTPDSVANSITGDIDIRVNAALASWTPASAQELIAKMSSAATRSWRFVMSATGMPAFLYSLDGTTENFAAATAATGYVNGVANRIRVTRVAATGEIRFYTYNASLSTYVQLGSAVAGVAGALFDSASPVEIGSLFLGTQERAIGKFYSASIHNGINGPTAAIFNPGPFAPGTTSFTASTGEVWTVNGSATLAADAPVATEGGMWKATSTGWQSVSFGEEISFTAGNNGVVDGVTLTQGASTATVTRVAQTTSAVSPARVGRLILTNRVGNFTAGPATTSGGGVLTLSGASSQLSLLPGGRYEFDNYNFSGSTDTLRMYWADGVNPAYEFDGTTAVPIRTGMVVDTPVYVRAYKNQLFLSFKGSSQNSGVGFPFIWTTQVGASEIGVGDDITGYSILPGETLAIAGRNTLRQLNGSTITDFSLKTISARRGAIPRTLQEMGQSFTLDDQGIIQISQTQAYGNFAENVVSRRVQPVINSIRGKIIGSVVYRTRNQYRIFCNDGTGLIMAQGVDGRGNPMYQYTLFDYNSGRTTNLINPTCMSASEDATGKDVIFFGADNGYVYQCEKGTSFDGEDIEAYLRMPFSDSKTPRIRKRYRNVIQEMSSEGYVSISFHPEFSYGNPTVATHPTIAQAIEGLGSYWDVGYWDQFFYDTQVVANPSFKINGTGLNLSLLYYSKSDYYASHNLEGAIIAYSPRRLER